MKADLDIVLHNVMKTAQIHGWELNRSHGVVRSVCKGIARNISKHGEWYCPCVIITAIPEEKRKEYTCPCTKAKSQVEEKGHCKCMLFWKKKEDPKKES